MKKLIGIIVIIAALWCIAAFSDIDNKKSSDEIIIGAPLSLTGTAATDGENIKKGIDLAVDELAEKGIKVKVVYEDDGSDGKRTISAVNKMIATNKPDAFIGPTWGIFVDAAGQVINTSEIVSFSPANTSEFVETKSKYLFFGSIKNELKREPIEKYLKENNKKRVGIIIDQSGWGESHIKPFEEAVANSGGEVIFTEKIPFGAEADTLPTILAKAKALNVDTLLVTGYEEGLTILIKRTQEQNPNMSLVIAEVIPKTLLKKGLISVSEKDDINVVIAQPSEEFISKYQAKYREFPGSYSDRGYDAVTLLVDALQNKSENESLADYLHNKTNYEGFAATYSFDENGDIKGGEWVLEKLQ